jgi:hypothetical protein
MVVLRACLIVLTIFFVHLMAVAQDSVGRIISLQGTARLKQPNGKVEILNEKNYWRSLHPNQKLKVDGNGQMQIALCDSPARLPVPSKRWYTVPSSIICSGTSNSKKREVLGRVFDIAARHRGENDFILFPAQSNELTDVIRAETAVFRWASSTKAKITLSVSVIGLENTKWEQSDIPGEDGSYSSDNLKTFLEDIQEKQPDAKLRLKIQTTFGTENSAIFQLLSKDKEEALQREIANVSEENKLLVHLSRAEIYLRHNLLIEAADQHEEALRLSPESIELLRATAAIEEQAGNLKRSNELEEYLEKLSKRANWP